MMTLSFNRQEFHSTQGQISDPGPYSAELAQFPDDLPALIDTIQGLMVHLHWTERYGLFLDKACKEEANIRTVRDRQRAGIPDDAVSFYRSPARPLAGDLFFNRNLINGETNAAKNKS